MGTALSIQSHPDKALAEELHVQRPEVGAGAGSDGRCVQLQTSVACMRPDPKSSCHRPCFTPPAPQVYKDANHKPEMALALTEFEALCSFAPHEELLASLASVPELAECCGAARVDALRAAPECSAQRRAALADAFHAVMACPPDAAAAHVQRMCARLEAAATGGRVLSAREALTLRLQEQYPGDVGVLAAWFLNYLRLAPGQAVALPANEPHAYLSGEIVEVMATSGARACRARAAMRHACRTAAAAAACCWGCTCRGWPCSLHSQHWPPCRLRPSPTFSSLPPAPPADNVIRAGLTPKMRDVEALCSSLTYGQGLPALLEGAKAACSRHLAVYRPPFR